MSKDSILTYVIGFVYGRSDLLRELLFAIDRDARKLKAPYRVIFLGNLIDRGPDPRGAVEIALHAVGRHQGAALILGFHENRLLRILDEKDHETRKQLTNHWLKTMKGWATLNSYGLPTRSTIDGIRDIVDERHVAFLRKAKRFVELDDHLVVHTGIKPGVDMLDQDLEPGLRPNPSFTRYRGSHGKIVVHGTTNAHNPVDAFPNRIAVNSLTYRDGMLSALCIEPDGGLQAIAARRPLIGGIEVVASVPFLQDWGRSLPRPPKGVS